MDNFEKSIFLTTLEKIWDEIDKDCHSFYELNNTLKSEYGFSYTKTKTIKHSFRYSGFSDDDLAEYCKSIKKQLSGKISKISKKNSALEKKYKIIKDLFQLNEIEYKYFIYYSLFEINPTFKILYKCLDGDIEDVIANNFLKVRSIVFDNTEKNMRNKNLMVRGHFRNEIKCNPILIDVLTSDSTNTTKQKIISKIVGKKQKSTLKVNDFEHISDEVETVTEILRSAIQQKTKGINILLYGSVGTGKTEFAKLTANIAKIPMYQVTVEDEDYKEAKRADRLCDLRTKNQILKISGNACILFDEAEDVMNRGFSDFGNGSKGYMNTMLENIDVPVIWTTNNIYGVDPAFLRRMTYCIGFEKLNENIRLNIWNRVLKKHKLKVSNQCIKELNKNYDIPPSLIANAVKTTKMINGDEKKFEKFIENVAKVVMKKQNVRKTKDFEMSDYDENLVNTDLNIQKLTEKIKKCEKLNFSLCLYGEPGTGKSLYAKYLAKELGVDVIFKRASDIMDKYVGGTEQNIAEAFAEAKSKKAMLIFDEADSFLQNRNNAVRSWEVSHVNEMLTQMESHEYPFVCTTNLLNTLDEASLRRFTFKIKFDFMTKEQTTFAFEHFFGIKDFDLGIRGLTAGDFATVKKKADFLNITDAEELREMLANEVKLKNSKELKNSVGFN